MRAAEQLRLDTKPGLSSETESQFQWILAETGCAVLSESLTNTTNNTSSGEIMLTLRHLDGSPTLETSDRWSAWLRLVRQEIREYDWQLRCLTDELDQCGPQSTRCRQQARDYAAVADQVWTVTSAYGLQCRLKSYELARQAEAFHERARTLPYEMALLRRRLNRLLEIEPRLLAKQRQARAWHDSELMAWQALNAA